MNDAVLARTEPAGADIEPEASERELRELYLHRSGVVRLGMIQSADGKTAGLDGSSRSLNGPADLRILRALRAVADVVVVGGQTARRERYGDIGLPEGLAASRTAYRSRTPDLAIVTRSGIVPSGLSPERTWIVTAAGTRAAALDGPWASRIIIAGADEFSPRTMIRELEARALTRILCEGGPTIAARLLQRKLVHEYCLTTSPEAGGPSAADNPPVPTGMRRAHRLEAGDFAFERWVAQP